MPDEPKSPGDAPNIGLPFEHFRAAVESLVKLRDDGKALLYFTRRPLLRLIGDARDFLIAFSIGKDGEEAAKVAAQVEAEIVDAASSVLRYETVERALHVMEGERFERRRKEKPADEHRDAYRHLQRQKLELVAKVIATENVRERVVRLGSSTGACLEEMDYELIQERIDVQRKKKVTAPFLRLRIRYSDIRQQQYLGGVFAFEGADERTPSSSFEIECDLSDIDLLIKRLGDAKQRLIDIGSPEDEGS